MLTYEVTTREDSCSEDVVRTVDCAYFQSDDNFIHFKNDAHKVVLAVPTSHVLAIDLKQEHDGAGETGVKLDVQVGDTDALHREIERMKTHGHRAV